MTKRTRRPLIAGNWKMNLDHVAAIRLVQDLALRMRSLDHRSLDVAVFPPFTDLRSVESVIGAEHLPMVLGAQHCSPFPDGAYTGEVSLSMLARLGVGMVIVGHSERRQLFGMDDERVAQTALAVHLAQLTPVICVGETEEERQAGETDAVLERQVRALLRGVPAGLEERTVLAYEPIWAIGTGVAATPEDAQSACAAIRQLVGSERGEAASEARILYGGSAKPENAEELVGLPDVDGLLVGGASLQADSFAAIIAAAASCYGS
jgi:triosephosphate isomerase (TIM)